MKTGDRCRVPAVVLTLVVGAWAAEVWDGITLDTIPLKSGASPVIIRTPEQLAGLAYLVNTEPSPVVSKKTFTLANDIALNVSEDERNGAPPNQWTAIGAKKEKPFQGTFDGAGFVVRGVYIDNADLDYQGLFGVKSGTVKRLRVDESSVVGKDFVGGLVGFDSSGRIDDCYSTAAVEGVNYVGGLVGYKKGSVASSYATGNVSGRGRNIGGLIGFKVNNTNVADSIKGCYATGEVHGDGNFVGGLVGRDSGVAVVINSYAAGEVYGDRGVGGLVGSSTAVITNCYAKGNVSGIDSVGGFVGSKVGAAIRNSYAAGAVSGDGDSVGGLAGALDGATVTYGYYRSDSIGGGGLGIPKTKAEMQSEGFVSLLNVAAYAMRATASANRWIYSGGQYPTLSGDPVTDATFAACFAVGPDGKRGNGSEGNPYLLETTQHLENLAMYVNCGADLRTNGFFKLIKDIFINDTAKWRSWGPDNRPAKEWTAIGQQPRDTTVRPRVRFNGTFDGDGHVIGGVYVNRGGDTTHAGRYQGLFGRVDTGTIKNLGVVGSYVNGYSYVGGLAGWNSGRNGTITKCFVRNAKIDATGGINGAGGIGGLAGKNSDEGKVRNCFATADVVGTVNMAGGLVGWNSNKSEVIYCSSTGNVSVTGDDVGGLVGRNDTNSTVINSYATGNVSAIGDVVGGLVGINIGATVDTCYAVGKVTGSSSVGGLVGLRMMSNVGRTGSNSYYKADAVAIVNDYGIPKTDDEMRRESTYQDWNFKSVWAIDTTGGGGYPYLGMVRAAKPTITTQPQGDSVAIGAKLTITVAATSSDGGAISYQWYSNLADSNSGGTKIDGATNASFVVPTAAGLVRYYYAVATNTIADNGDGGAKTASAASDAVRVAFTGEIIAVLSPDRVIPKYDYDNESAALSPPPPAPAAEFTAGPNPAGKSSGAVSFFRKGKRIAECELRVYDASGNTVSKVKIEDRASAQGRRNVGSWNLTDAKGRRVSEGTYLVKGSVVGTDGKREKVSILVGVK